MQPWKKLTNDLVYDGFRKIRRKKFLLPDGLEVDYDTVGQNSEIVCVAAMTSDQKIILARQFRTGPEKLFDELPGGGVDAGERPEQAAARELLEETGYQAGNAGVRIYMGQVSPPFYEKPLLNEAVFLFVTFLYGFFIK